MDIDLEILINIRYLIPVSQLTIPNTINQPIIGIVKGFVKWNVERGYLKRHVVVDIKRKRILSLKVTNKQVQDGKVSPEMINDITKKNNKIIIDTAIKDGSYDSNKNFQFSII